MLPMFAAALPIFPRALAACLRGELESQAAPRTRQGVAFDITEVSLTQVNSARLL